VNNIPASWSTQVTGQPGDILDGRMGGVPDPNQIGPAMIQIGTEGGFLPAPVIWPNVPLGYDRDIKSITVTNVKEHNLWLGPAERADVLIDFSKFAGQTLILYNDSPAGVPATDSRLDYCTNDLDQTAIAGYNSAYNATFPVDTTAYARIQSMSLTFKPLNLLTATPGDQVATAITQNFQPKAIQELFENDYGRMNATLGVELKFNNGTNQATIPYGYVDPITEFITDTPNVTTVPIGTLGDGTQIWKITHNGTCEYDQLY
jgi:hypothetical protein